MKKLLLTILALALLAEEWLWDKLTAFGDRLFVWFHLAGFERRLARASPRVAMAALLLPVALVLPVKFAALWLFAHGQIARGLALLIAAKLLATLLVSRMFAATRPQLLSFAWFAALYAAVTRWLGWARERVRASAAYRQALRLKRLARAKLAEWLKP